MLKLSYEDFTIKLEQAFRKPMPLSGLLELTYGCNLNCVHCYCKGSENCKGELSLKEWKSIIDQVHKEGCLWLNLSGGEPFFRPDFLEIYDYAYKKGFLITILTNGTILPAEALHYLKSHPPYSLEVSVYATSEKIYESVSGVPGSFCGLMKNIDRLLRIKVNLVFKTIGLRQIKNEVLKVKALAGRLLGKNRFKFDSLVFPRTNGDKAPCSYRLSNGEVIEIENSDADILEFKHLLATGVCSMKNLSSGQRHSYQCYAWMSRFSIDPFGGVSFCHLIKKPRSNLKEISFKQAFFQEFPKILNKFIIIPECLNCQIKNYCFFCPAKGILESGEYKSPVEYYCALAAMRYRETAGKQASIRACV